MKDLEEQIEFFERETKANMNSAWGSIYGPLRNLFYICKEFLGSIDQLRSEVIPSREKVDELESRLKKLETSQ